MRRRGKLAADFVAVSVLLRPSQLEALDALSAFYKLSRQDVLLRGLFILDALETVRAAPSGAVVNVSLVCPEHGVPMLRG